jgi:hypothetical protein
MYNRGLGEEYQTCEVDSVDDVQAKIDAMDVFYNEHKLSGIELQIKIRPRK